jgi:hypothetical protein
MTREAFRQFVETEVADRLRPSFDDIFEETPEGGGAPDMDGCSNE